MKKFFRIFLWVLAIGLFAGTFVYLYLHSRPKEVTYETVSPFITDINRSTILTGTIEPRDEIAIKPQVSGIIAEINVEEGDMVKVGDIVARIKIVPDEGQLSSATSRIEQARISLADARTRHERNTLLLDKKVISREEFDTSATQLAQAEAELRAAEDAYAIVKEGVSHLHATESNTLVRSTVTGLVLEVPVKVGTSVIQSNTFNDGTTIATVADMNNLIFKGKVDETEVGLLSQGQSMDVTIGALPDLHIPAGIELISPKGVQNNGANTFEIKGALSIPDSLFLRSGYSANATVLLSSAPGVLAVPESILEWGADSTYVYVLTDSVKSEYRRVPVTTGTSDDINIQITSGFSECMKLRGALVNKPK